MEPEFKIRLAGRLEPRSKSDDDDELAISVIEQRPILNATRLLPLDLGAELLSDLGSGEFAAGVNECLTAGSPTIPPQGGRSSICHRRATRRSVLNFSVSVMPPPTRRADAMPSAFLCGADSELYPVAPRLLAKRVETGRRTRWAPAKGAMPADLAWASCKLWSKALALRRRRPGLS
jgi:hypothetical protein